MKEFRQEDWTWAETWINSHGYKKYLGDLVDSEFHMQKRLCHVGLLIDILSVYVCIIYTVDLK